MDEEQHMGRENTASLKVDLKMDQTIEEVFDIDKCNVGGVTLDEDTKELRTVGYNQARTECKFWDKEFEEDKGVLEALVPKNSEVVPASKTRDQKTQVVAFVGLDGPTEYVIYDQGKKTTAPLFVSKPDLLNYKFASNPAGLINIFHVRHTYS